MRNRRYSRQREKILSLLKNLDSHPSAEWIYSKLKEELPGLSLGTVYRNLLLLAEEGEISAVTDDGKALRYDARKDEHIHFICKRCGTILDIEGPIEVKFNTPDSLDVQQTKVQLYGECLKCRNNRE